MSEPHDWIYTTSRDMTVSREVWSAGGILSASAPAPLAIPVFAALPHRSIGTLQPVAKTGRPEGASQVRGWSTWTARRREQDQGLRSVLVEVPLSDEPTRMLP